MVNKAIIVGNLGRDPELRFTQSGKAVCNFPVATSEKWTDQDGNKQERTEWHQVTVWGGAAENAAKYLAKGRTVYVEGSIRSNEYEDREGVRRRSTQIHAQRVQFIGGAQHNNDEDVPI